MLTVKLNGKDHTVDVAATLTDLIAELGLLPERVVVERNRDIVSRADFADTVLQTGDEIEIVHFVGGG